MAIRIGQYVIGGFISSARRNSVHGWLAFDEERGLHFELLGDLSGDLAGRRIEFHVPSAAPADDGVITQLLNDLQQNQIGAAGDMCLRMMRVPTGPINELPTGSLMDEPPPIDERLCLHLEWFGQNGGVVAEILNPVIEDYVDDDVAETGSSDSSTDSPECDSDFEALSIEFDALDDTPPYDAQDFDEDDPYGLFPEDLEQELSETSGSQEFEEASADSSQPRDWEDIIPGIDPETKAMYEQWDEIYGGQKDELISNLFEPPMQLPHVDDVTDEATARRYVLQIAARLATLGVAIDLCPHYTMLKTYRWLLSEILPKGHVHPKLRPTGIVFHYSSFEYCEECDAEFEAKYQERQDGE